MASETTNFFKEALKKVRSPEFRQALGDVGVTPPDDPLARLVALDRERRELEDRLKAIIKERAPLEEILLEQWADRGQQNANVNGLTVYVRPDFVCSKRKEIPTSYLVDVLNQHGLARYVETGYDASGLKAWFKEQLKEGSDLPESVASCFNYNTITRLVSTKGSRSDSE